MFQSNTLLQSSPAQTSLLNYQNREQKPLFVTVTKLWGYLPKIHLTKNALNELNHRSKQPKTFRVTPHCNLDISPDQLEYIRKLARDGGPDLTDIRGYPEPDDDAMESGQQSQSSQQTKPSKISKKTKTTGPYDNNFKVMLQAHGIYGYPYDGPNPDFPIEPLNLEEMIKRAKKDRASVTPETVPDNVFVTFKRTVLLAENESEVVDHLVPILEKGINIEKKAYNDTTFSNLEQFGSVGIEQIALAKGTPDRCYGSPYDRLCEKVQKDLDSKVVPTSNKTNPIAPNFFLELKGPGGRQQVADLQAVYYGALGERGQIALRSWGLDGLVIDGMAHTISCTYVSGCLKFFAILASRSSQIDSGIEYSMHLIKYYPMDESPSKFRKAIAAYQNLQDYAEEKRDEAIELANSRARNLEGAP